MPSDALTFLLSTITGAFEIFITGCAPEKLNYRETTGIVLNLKFTQGKAHESNILRTEF